MNPARRATVLHTQRQFVPAPFVQLGDSVTAGGQAGVTPGVHEYGAQCLPLLRGKCTRTNFAVGGRYIDNPANSTDMLGDVPAASLLLNPLARWGFGSTCTGVLTVFGGINDWTSGGASGATIISRMSALLTAARAAGWSGTNKIVVLSLFGIDDPDAATYNDWLDLQIGAGLCDGVVRTGQVPALRNRDIAGTYIENPNGIHPNAAAHANIIAPLVAAKINEVVGLPA